MALWRPVALIQLGWALSQQGTATGLDEIEAGMRELGQIGARRIEMMHVGFVAEAYDRAGRRDEAQARSERAFARALVDALRT